MCLEAIKCTPSDLDEVKEMFKDFSHFTVRNGKAHYHMVYLANRSSGVFYAVRSKGPYLEGKRQLEPLTEITCWGRGMRIEEPFWTFHH